MGLDPLTGTLLEKAKNLLKLVEQENSPIRNSLKQERDLSETLVDLKNITRSLDQYARTDRGFRYVGFVGHFSAGKSSTINSLLGAQVRKTGLEPTDNEITLVSHPQNTGSMIGAHSKGLLRVSSCEVASPFLETTFLVDSPGSGDPDIIEGMVRDFLPVCDLIVYVFSATSAFDNADLPVLKTLAEKLPFVPMRFVVTRAGEFRVNENAETSVSNLNQVRYGKFLGDLISRLRQHLPQRDITAEDFYLIDNRSSFGVDKLRTGVASAIDDVKELHSSKIAYFQTQLNQTGERFENYLASLSHSMDELKRKAEENRAEYDNRVQISVQSLRDFWEKLERQLRGYVEEFDSLSERVATRAQAPALQFVGRWKLSDQAFEQVKQEEAAITKGLRDSLFGTANASFNEQRALLSGKIQAIAHLKDFDDAGWNPTIDPSPIAQKYARLLKATVNKAVRKARASFLSEVEKERDANLDALRSTAFHASRANLLRKEEEAFSDYSELIFKNIRDYLPIIHLFRTHVTSSTARDLIARTGLGQQLDVLDQARFDQGRAQELAEQTVKKIFALREESRKSLKLSADGLADAVAIADGQFDRIDGIISRLTKAADSAEVGVGDALSEEIVVRGIDGAVHLAEEGLKRTRAGVVERIQGTLIAVAQEQARETTEFRRAWWWRLAGAGTVGGIVAALVYSALIWTKASEQLGIPLTVILSVVTQAVISSLAWGLSKIFLTQGRVLPKLRNALSDEGRKALVEAVQSSWFQSTAAWDSEFKNVGAELLAFIAKEVATDGVRATQEYEHLAAENKQVFQAALEAIRKYAQEWSQFSDRVTTWYRDEEAKEAMFSDMASELKSQSIEPALNLLSERLKEVRAFREKVAEIRF